MFACLSCLAAPQYPMAGAPQYPQQGEFYSLSIIEFYLNLCSGFGVDKPQAGGKKK